MGNQSNPWDLVVTGAGSGGVGAAIAAARMGLRVLLLERGPAVGGNAAHGGVNMWEPGVGGTGIPFEIYRRLRQVPQAVDIYSFGRHYGWPESNSPAFPGGEHVIDPQRRYVDTLRRYGSQGLANDEAFLRQHGHGVVFEPAAYVDVVNEMMRETGCIEIRTGVAFVDAQCSDGTVQAVTLCDGSTIEANAWIDATHTAALCSACGAGTAAPGSARLNAVTLMYRITPASSPQIEPLPPDVPAECWWESSFPLMSCVQYPCGDRNCNMLPTMSGEQCIRLGPDAAYAECARRVRAHWHWVQQDFPEFQNYRLSWLAPRLGVRETVHIECEYMLNAADLTRGISQQDHRDIIALADHAFDRHGDGGGCVELAQPYGIPFRSLVPKGLHNVLIASMAAGFTPEAATSCRLSRTMMQLGQAAGTAAAFTARLSVSPKQVPAEELQNALRNERVQVDWPMPDMLLQYVLDEHR